ncbi:MAG TPA: hypothetical protein VF033_06640 [Steroidobacteraceae bacterium]|jgi:hypothetical protein
MRIAKPLILTMTPIGLVWGLIEAARFHWWLAVLMGVLLSVIGLFIWSVVLRIRRERAESAGGSQKP